MSELFKEITPHVKLLYTYTPIPAYEKYIGAYLCTGRKNAIIDPGPKTAIPGLIKAIKEVGLQPEQIDYIMLTHIHIDHAGGTGTALKLLKNARVVVNQRGVKHLIDPAALTKGSIDTLGELVSEYGEIEPVDADRIITGEDGKIIDLGNSKLQIVLTPGHAAHHLCIFEPAKGVLFSGDTAGIFHNGLLRLTTPPPFRLRETLESLDKITALNPKIICYGHLGGYDDAKNRILEIKILLLHWYDYAQTRVKQGQSYTGVLDELIQEKPELSAYFAALDKDARKRDYNQLINSVTGLMTASS